MKYDCLVHIYNLHYEKDDIVIIGGLYTNCFVECDQLSDENSGGNNEKMVEVTESTENYKHDYNSICQKAGDTVGDRIMNLIKNPDSDPVKFEIEEVSLYDEVHSKLMGLALYKS